jgi:ribosome-associated protein
VTISDDFEHSEELEEEPIYAERPNKSALKRELASLQQLADRLLGFSEERLASLAFSEKTTLALAEGRRLKKPDARRRHLRYLAKLLSMENVTAAEAFIENIDAKHATNTRHFHQLELWRDRLIDEGDQALAVLLQEKPDADRQQLRQLIRTAKNEREREKPPAAARKLFKLLRSLYDE